MKRICKKLNDIEVTQKRILGYQSTCRECFIKKLNSHSEFTFFSSRKFVSENSILTILKTTQVSKAAGIDNLSGCFLKDGAKVLSKPINDLISKLFLKRFPTPAK